MIKKKLTEFSQKIIDWIGSVQSLAAHTIFFVSIFIFGFSGLVDPDYVFAITTNILSIEAIYLAIFIQMTVNKHSDDLEEVSEDIEEIQENVEDIQEDVEDIQKDVDEIQEDVQDISEDVDELQEDVEEMNEEEEDTELSRYEYIEHTLESLLQEIHELKQHRNSHSNGNTHAHDAEVEK